MPKRNDNGNPLARARGQQKAAESVWFRRSAVGFRLFVEYYAQQPLGVVVTNDNVMLAGELDDSSSVVVNAEIVPKESASNIMKRKNGGAGMSRASKKRRRKRNKGGEEEECDSTKAPVEPCTPSNAASSAPATTQPMTNPDVKGMESPLLQAAVSFFGTRKDPQPRRRQLSFFQTMARPLPTTFRIRATADKLHRSKLLQEIQGLGNLVSEIALRPAESMTAAYSPQIFQCLLSKSQLSKDAPQLKQLLLEYSQNGTIARQELGSMLPVLILALGRHLKMGDCVVDMCASPGSKTLQALEQVVVVDSEDEAALHTTTKQGTANKSHRRRQGLVLANDILESRLDALRAAVQRSGVPDAYTKRIRYSQVDATKLSLSSPCDAVLCDVPCSGDGTCRKDAHILPMWKPQAGNLLHSTQLAILKRSLELVKVGGVVCYSTCSLNPVENEAVVAAALTAFRGTVELLEITGLADWKYRRGVSAWKVATYVEEAAGAKLADNDDDEEETPKLTWYKTYEDAVAAGQMKEALPSMWPTSTPQANSSFHLCRCARLLPQDYDSGGFFLALLRKRK